VVAERDSIVGIATCYGLDGSGLEPRCGQEIFTFPHPYKPALGPTQAPIQWVPGILSRVKRPERGFDNPLPTSAEVIKSWHSYTSTPLLCLHGVLGGDLHLYIPLGILLLIQARQPHPL
jgi:hypothetical protein